MSLLPSPADANYIYRYFFLLHCGMCHRVVVVSNLKGITQDRGGNGAAPIVNLFFFFEIRFIVRGYSYKARKGIRLLKGYRYGCYM
jgi:hypothetical protein